MDPKITGFKSSICSCSRRVTGRVTGRSPLKWSYSISSVPKSLTICLLNFSKLILIVSWGEIFLLVMLSYCDPLPGLLICRNRGSLSPTIHGKIVK